MDLTEARAPVTAYGSLDELFVRHLRPGVRSWPREPGVVASPVDGVVGSFGRIEGGDLLQAKGRTYTVAELLDDAELAARFEAGGYATLYLAPRHYHRIHAPVGGTIRQARHIPGRLLPVNRPAVSRIDRLFPRNERLLTVIDEAPGSGAGSGRGALAGLGPGPGSVAVVAVGAFNVGRITADFDPSLVTNRRGARAETRRYDLPVRVDRGDGLMAFHLGSTVVLLFERPVVFAPAVAWGHEVRLGDALTD
jgi:phosphatidylserine decarboxylase